MDAGPSESQAAPGINVLCLLDTLDAVVPFLGWHAYLALLRASRWHAEVLSEGRCLRALLATLIPGFGLVPAPTGRKRPRY